MGTEATGTRRARDGGFTLIELLVVIIVLGILAGVVVFAVRGSGDKGRTNAEASDARIVRTAQEAFCASYDRYAASMDELVNGPLNSTGGRDGRGFLSEESQYHRIVVPGSASNSCGSYGLEEIPPGSSTSTTAVPRCQPAQWCDAAKPVGRRIDEVSSLVQLKNGKVLISGETRHDLPQEPVLGVNSTMGVMMHLYDPASGELGTWSDAAPVRARGQNVALVNDMVLLDGDPDQCSPRCGMVLAYVAGVTDPDTQLVGHWSLYDPTHNQWTPLEAVKQWPNDFSVAIVRLAGSGCGDHCGKVLVVGASSSGPGLGTAAELYDPTTNEFQDLGGYGNQAKGWAWVSAVALNDGRAFIHQIRQCNAAPPVDCGTGSSARVSVVFLFRPDGSPGNWFQNVPAPGTGATRCVSETQCWKEGIPSERYQKEDVARVLPDGRVLMLFQRLDIYSPGPPGEDGTWTSLENCVASGGTVTRCVILGKVENGSGTILGRRIISGDETQPDTFLIDPGVTPPASPYSDGPPMLEPYAGIPGVWLSGNCANCRTLLTTRTRVTEEPNPVPLLPPTVVVEPFAQLYAP